MVCFLRAAENSRDCCEDNRQCGPNCTSDCPATQALYLTDMPQGDQSIFWGQVQLQNTAVVSASMSCHQHNCSSYGFL